MHFVAPNRHPRRKLDPASLGEALGFGQNGLNLKEAQPGHRLFPSFDTERIGDALAEHLISAAKAEDSSALAPVREEVNVPPLASQELEIADRRLRTGKDDKR